MPPLPKGGMGILNLMNPTVKGWGRKASGNAAITDELIWVIDHGWSLTVSGIAENIMAALVEGRPDLIETQRRTS